MTAFLIILAILYVIIGAILAYMLTANTVIKWTFKEIRGFLYLTFMWLPMIVSRWLFNLGELK